MERSGDWSYCPACGGEIDTGYECGKCGRDWLEFHETRQALLDKHQAALAAKQQQLAAREAELEARAFTISPETQELLDMQAVTIARLEAELARLKGAV